MPQYDDQDPLAALDFVEDKPASDAESDELAFLDYPAHASHDDVVEQSDAALDTYVPEPTGRGPDDTETALDAVAPLPTAQAGQGAVGMYTVINPPETVSVSALLDGTTGRVALSAKVTSMSEAELAEEILIIADLARRQALAGQQAYLLGGDSLAETMRELGSDGSEVVREFMENGLGLTTQDQADAARAEVFAARYGRNK
ncbi:hypothetical protein AAHS21_25780 [Mycobacterium sp. 050272]|uniref:hypothetical protein n=1 Tax=Mycobacterium sp. 050272 TaxID=3142488 RepID=UPI0031937233